MPAACEITLKMREPVQAIRQSCGNESAAQSFHSLFLWQRDMKLSICLREKVFAVRCEYWEQNSWFFPCGEKEAVDGMIRELLESEPRVSFLYLREEDAVLLRQRFPGRFRIETVPDASEYLYDRAAYVTMPGKEYEDTRWSINHLRKRHDLRTEVLSTENLPTAREMLARWHSVSKSTYFAEDMATADLMLSNFPELGMDGVIVLMDGEPMALAAGFPVSGHSYDIAFSKALVRERGLQFYVRRELISRLPGQYTVINGEEDLGIPDLRQSKLQERPVGRIEMFRAYAE